jgi:hypothetical protein
VGDFIEGMTAGEEDYLVYGLGTGPTAITAQEMLDRLKRFLDHLQVPYTATPLYTSIYVISATDRSGPRVLRGVYVAPRITWFPGG